MLDKKEKKERSGKNGINGEAPVTANCSRPSARQRVACVGMFWDLLFSFVFITLFVSTFGVLLFATAVILREFWLKKHQVAVLPQPFIAWIHQTRIYDVFVRRIHANRNLRACRYCGIWFFTIGVIILATNITRPVLDLEEMVVERGTYSHVIKLGRRNPCGNVLLTFHREDGTPFQFWGSRHDYSEMFQ